MADLGTLADAAQILGALTVVIGLVFVAFQIREARRQRVESASLAVLTSYLQDATLHEAFRRVVALPDNWVTDERFLKDAELIRQIDRLHMRFDASGFMVFQGALRLDHVAGLEGDILLACWTKLAPFARMERERQGRQGPFEWTEWLVDRLQERSETGPRRGAFEAHRNWRQ